MENTVVGSWKKIDSGWKRILSVVTLVTALSAITVTITGWEIPKVTACYILAGLVVLFAGWMLDDHVKEFNETNKKNETRFNHIDKVLTEIKIHSLETHRDTLRLQLYNYMKDQPENKDTILSLAEEYFCKLNGDLYMTNEFMKWAEKNNVEPSLILSCKIERHK